MCGIFGYVGETPASQPIQNWAESARRALLHRGPDGSEIQEFLEGHCIFGHTRLSVIDLEGGTQPLCNEDGSVWITFNGEIYNYVELRDELKSRHDFKTHSDTEVLVHLYEEKGEKMLDDLVGMFAFAILDTKKRSVFLARDRFGEKPLYYAGLPDGSWAFASELKALRTLPGIDLSPDWAAVAQYLALGYAPAPRTHVIGIRKLRASESVTLTAGQTARPRRYWNLEFSGTDTRSAPVLIDEFRDRFRESVRLRLRSDVPLGAFLSGGIDSTLVVMAMRELLPASELRTFCAGFDHALLDERPYAREIADLAYSRHREITLQEEDLASDLTGLMDHYDEPFADYSNLATYAVCKKAREEVTVILSGDGADEFFGGYGRYYQYSSWHGLRRTPGVNFLAASLSRFWPKGKSGSGVLTFLGRSDEDFLRSYGDFELARSFFRPEYRDRCSEGLTELVSILNAHGSQRYPLSLMEAQACDLMLPEQLMVKVDRASMKSGLETRAPFLDHRLAEFAARIATETNFRSGLGKMLLRDALPKIVPEGIRWRSKRGFTPPLATWFRTVLREKLRNCLDEVPEPLRQATTPEVLQPYFDAHISGKEDYQDVLFRWMALVRCFEFSAAATTDGVPRRAV
jgi:asparagine synthase (glutamine-hydrolysing)